MDELEAVTPEPAPALPLAESPTGSGKTYTVAQKLEFLKAYDAWQGPMEAFCSEAGITSASLCKWRRVFRLQGEAGLEPQLNPRNTHGLSHIAYTPEERLAAVEAFQKSGLSALAFAKIWDVSASTLQVWARALEARGPSALLHPQSGLPRARSGRPGMAEGLKTAILGTQHRFPTFGLRKIRDALYRFGGLKVSTGSVRKTLREAGVRRQAPARRRRGRSEAVRRFERARPNQLWQTDLTSFTLPRHGQRVYLVVFLDDCSRFVVSWGLALQQKQELVLETLLRGIEAHGKPEEVLSDQGRQYFAWRGKSDFGKLLAKQGIHHVVARAHHPETVGKCERLWATVGDEFWDRVQPQDFDDAKARLAHFFHHYNFQRPHQGLGGMLPADRFFGVESLVRQALERTLHANELALALGEAPRKPVFLVGQIGDQQVNLVGEQGRLVLSLPDQPTTELTYATMSATSALEEVSHDGPHDDPGSLDPTPLPPGPDAPRPAHEDLAAPQDARPGAGPLGQRGPDRPAEGPGGRLGAPGSLAGPDLPRGRSGTPEFDPGAPLADEPAGDLRDGRGPLEAAPRPQAGAGPTQDPAESGPHVPPEASARAATPESDPGGAHPGLATAAGEPSREVAAPPDGGEKKSGAQDPSPSGTASDAGCACAPSSGLTAPASPASWESPCAP